MTDELVLTDVQADGVATLRLNRPPMNALSQALLAGIGDAAQRLTDDEAVKAVVVLGGEKAFAAGADITEFGDQAAAKRMGRAFRDAFDRLAAIPRPVIAAVNGFALGGGLELAMSCDLRIASEKARVGQPEILLGIIPGAGGTQRLPRLVGPARAKELIWSGRQVKADEALAIGLVDRVVPADELEDEAVAWAGELASGAVVAMGLAKGAIDGGLDGSLARGLDLEAEAFIEVFGTDDARVGVASFLEHGPGKATFSGR
jgi:enoyl-CoA hydratase/carnithine racemase